MIHLWTGPAREMTKGYLRVSKGMAKEDANGLSEGQNGVAAGRYLAGKWVKHACICNAYSLL